MYFTIRVILSEITVLLWCLAGLLFSDRSNFSSRQYWILLSIPGPPKTDSDPGETDFAPPPSHSKGVPAKNQNTCNIFGPRVSGPLSGLRGPVFLPASLSSRLHWFPPHTGLTSNAVYGKREVQMAFTIHREGKLQRLFALQQAVHMLTNAFNRPETDVGLYAIPGRLRGLHTNK